MTITTDPSSFAPLSASASGGRAQDDEGEGADQRS
jgi:hypothetical protein